MALQVMFVEGYLPYHTFIQLSRACRDFAQQEWLRVDGLAYCSLQEKLLAAVLREQLLPYRRCHKDIIMYNPGVSLRAIFDDWRAMPSVLRAIRAMCAQHPNTQWHGHLFRRHNYDEIQILQKRRKCERFAENGNELLAQALGDLPANLEVKARFFLSYTQVETLKP